MITKHTPWKAVKLLGNWHGYSDWSTYTIRDSRNICLAVVGEVDRAACKDSGAVADILAAAPDLLKALKVITVRYLALAHSGDAGFWDVENETEVVQARAAISKAKGES